MNLFCGFIIGCCPWVNLLYTWSISYMDGDKKNLKISSVLLALEVILLVLYLFSDKPIFALLDLIIFLISLIYTIRFLYEDFQERAPKALVSILMLTFLSSFTLLTNLVLIFRIDRKQNAYWFFYLIFLLALNFVPSQFHMIMTGLTMANIIFYTISKRDPLNMDDLTSFIKGKKNIQSNNNTINQPLTNQATTTNTNRKAHDQFVVHDVHVVDANLQYNTYDRGWSVDDTINLEVNILTIEDIIFPITLKNEYEKIMKDLIIYIRKLDRYENTDIEILFGDEGLSSYLKVFFSKLKLQEVRTVYAKSLFLILNHYSARDSRVTMYLDKLELRQASLLNPIETKFNY